jgi:hypothetical protein
MERRETSSLNEFCDASTATGSLRRVRREE